MAGWWSFFTPKSRAGPWLSPMRSRQRRPRERENGIRQLFRGFQARPEDRSRDAENARPWRCRTLYRALWFALCDAVVGSVRPILRTAARTARRPVGISHGVRQDGAGHLS